MAKQELMFSLVELYEQGDLTISAFCRANNIKVPTFHYWRRKFRQSRSAVKGFIPIHLPASTEPVMVRLAYPNGVSIHLPAADIALIAQLIRLA